jgi:hypothetical protein
MHDDRDDRSLDEKLAPQDFVTDFVWAGRAVLSQPSVAFVSIGLWLIPIAFGPLVGKRSIVMALACVGILLFMLGWDGIERVFFLARREGRSVTLGQLFASVPFFVGRFARLGLLIALAAIPLVVIIDVCVGRFYPGAPHAARVAASRIEFATIMVPMDIALTFVTSALVFTTRSARQAFRIGLSMIRQTWPRSGLYILCPPLALNMLNTIYPTQIPLVRVVTTAGFALLALLAKGATAAFYLRERPASPDVVADAI